MCKSEPTKQDLQELILGPIFETAFNHTRETKVSRGERCDTVLPQFGPITALIDQHHRRVA
jgi:hypothetical protein